MQAKIKGVNLSYDDHGRGPTVLFIHDFPLNRKMWQAQIDAVSAAGFRVITPDLRGFGNSDVESEGCSISTYSEDIIGLLNYLGIGRAVVCGLSMGGYILLDLLENHPQRVAGACLVSTRPVADDSHERAKRSELLNALKCGQIDDVREELFQMLIGTQDDRLSKDCRNEIQSLTRCTSPEALSNAILAITRRKDYTFQLQQMKVPTLVIGAEQDSITHPQHSEIMARQLPNCYKSIKLNCGHLVNMEKVQAFNQHLIDFLYRLNPHQASTAAQLQPAV